MGDKTYNAVIDEVEERIAKNRKLQGHGSCYEYLHLQQAFLAEYAIVWHTPKELNPKVHFDGPRCLHKLIDGNLAAWYLTNFHHPNCHNDADHCYSPA